MCVFVFLSLSASFLSSGSVFASCWFFSSAYPTYQAENQIILLYGLILTEQKKGWLEKKKHCANILDCCLCVLDLLLHTFFETEFIVLLCFDILLKTKIQKKKRFRTCVRMCICACVEIALNLLSIYLCFISHDCFVFVLTSPIANISIMPQIANEKSDLRWKEIEQISDRSIKRSIMKGNFLLWYWIGWGASYQGCLITRTAFKQLVNICWPIKFQTIKWQAIWISNRFGNYLNNFTQHSSLAARIQIGKKQKRKSKNRYECGQLVLFVREKTLRLNKQKKLLLKNSKLLHLMWCCVVGCYVNFNAYCLRARVPSFRRTFFQIEQIYANFHKRLFLWAASCCFDSMFIVKTIFTNTGKKSNHNEIPVDFFIHEEDVEDEVMKPTWIMIR